MQGIIRKLPFKAMMKPLHELVRTSIWELATNDESSKATAKQDDKILLDANENPYNWPLNRYPDSLQYELKTELARIRDVVPSKIFVGNGIHEAADLCFRIFCQPQKDNVVAIEPTDSVYKKLANINDVEYRSVALDDNFELHACKLLSACDKNTKIIWLCSPNNPTGNNLNGEQMEEILRGFDGIVIIDESYSDFSTEPVFRKRIDEFPNIIVLNTMNNSWGCAALNIGTAYSSPDIIKLFNAVKYPYNISKPTQEQAVEILRDGSETDKFVSIICQERSRLLLAFAELPYCERVYTSQANFILVKMTNAKAVYNYLIEKGICVSNLSDVALCNNCLRITIGTKNENLLLLSALRQY